MNGLFWNLLSYIGLRKIIDVYDFGIQGLMYYLKHDFKQIIIFPIRFLSVLRGHSVFSSPPQQPMTSDFEGFLYQILSITFIFLS